MKGSELSEQIVKGRTDEGKFHQRVHLQLLRVQIPKAQKAALVDCLFCASWTCAHVKAAREHVGEIDSRENR